MNRREVMQAVAGIATARWATEDYDPANVDEWEPIENGIYKTGTFDAQELWGSGDSPLARIAFEDRDFDERALNVAYDQDGPHMSIDAHAEDRSTRFSLFAELTPEDARQLAGALYQAAWEYENRDVERNR